MRTVGFPTLRDAGNVLRPSSAVKLSIRLPPAVASDAAAEGLKALLEKDPPHGAKVTFEVDKHANGWDAPPLASWLEEAADAASRRHFGGKPACYMGEGGSIPFMGMLGRRYPHAQFLVTGVLGPGSNAHGPNECLDLEFACRLTMCVADVCAAYHDHLQSQ